MRRLRCLSLTAVLLASGLLGAGCGAHPEGFQEPCDLASEALAALDDGDVESAEDAIDDARLWIDAAYEDTSGSERDAVDDFYAAVDRAWADVRSDDGPTGAGRQALVEAEVACS
jgi:hypothetical protein